MTLQTSSFVELVGLNANLPLEVVSLERQSNAHIAPSSSNQFLSEC
jgi:hypothetical protein